MLGKHADHFFAQQARERVLAITPNAGGRSLSVPDRERAGSAHVTVRGGQQMPGPQRVVSSGAMPGMGHVAAPAAPVRTSGALPGMGGGALPGMSGGALPGMSGSSALPGMGFLSTNMLMTGLAVGLGAFLLLKKR